MSIRIILKILLNGFLDPGADDIGFVTGLFFRPVGRSVLFTQLIDEVTPLRFLDIFTNHMLVNNFFNTCRISRIIHSLTRIL